MQSRSFSRSRWGALSLLAVLLAAPSAWAQTASDGYRFSQRQPALNARLMAMSGAGSLAGIADQGALHANPAGLGFLNTSVFAGGLNTLSAVDDATYGLGSGLSAREADVRNTGLHNLAYLAKVPTAQGALVLGASLTTTNNFTRFLRYDGENPNNSITDFFMPVPGEFDVEIDPGDDNVPGTNDDVYFPTFSRDLSNLAFQTYAIDLDIDAFEAGEAVPFFPAVLTGTVAQAGEVSEDGTMRELSFGGAVEASPGVMAGLSANIVFGTYEFQSLFDEDDFQNANDGNFNTVDFASLTFEERFESELTGFNLKGGFSAAVTPNLRVGLALETPTWYNVNEHFDTYLTTRFDNGEVFNAGGGSDAGSGVFEYQLQTPWRLGGGLAFTSDDLMLAADVEFVDWSQMEFDADASEGYFDEINRNIRDGYDAVVNVALGGEYTLDALKLRAGFAYHPDPRDLDGSDDDLDRSKTYFSAGIGYRFSEQFQLDFGWMQERFEDQFMPYSDVANGPAPLIREDLVRNRFAVGISVFF